MRTVIMTIIMDIFNATWLSLSHTPGADGPSFSFHWKNADICMIYTIQTIETKVSLVHVIGGNL